jgi:putative peptidoglycan lipid II flippase
LLKTESYTRGAIFSVLFNAAAKFIQFLNIFIIASLFGASTETDLYYFLFNFATIVIAGFISSIDAIVLMPEFIRLRDSVSIRKAIGFINKYLYIYMCLGLIIFLIGLINPISFFSIVSNFNRDILINNRLELIMSLLLILLIISCNLLTSVLATYKYFTIPNIVAFINNILSLIFLLIFYKKYGIVSAMVGITLGYFINAIFLVYILIKKIKWNFFWVDKSADIRIIKFIGATQITAFIVSLRLYATQFLLSGFGGGILTAINWGNQIGGLGEVFINAQLYTVSGIKFSEFYTTNKKEGAIQFFYTLISLLLTIGCIMFVVLFTCNSEIASIINFKNKFTNDVLVALSLSIVFLNIVPLINIFTFLSSKILASFQLINFKVVRNSLVGQSLLLIILWLGVKCWGYYGYFISSIIGFLIIALLYLMLVKRYFDTFSFLTLIKRNVGTVAISAFLIIAIESANYFTLFPHNLHVILKLFIITTLVVLVFLKKLKNNFMEFRTAIQ